MAEPEIIDIDPGGDVVFVCTAEDGHSASIRVLSVFVSTASPVMKAMLGPKFKEGNTLAANSSVEIPLPDDDPMAMELIFRAMHMRISSLPTSLDLGQVKELAAAIDKYDCAGPLAPMTYYWVHGRLLKPFVGIAELHELLHVTYLLGQQELFGQIGIKLVLESPSPIKGTHDGLVHAYDALEKQRLEAAMSLVSFVQHNASNVFMTFSPCTDKDCIFTLRQSANFRRILEKSQLWGLRLNAFKLEDALLAMRKIGFGGMEEGCNQHDSFCRIYATSSQNCDLAFGFHAAEVKEKLLPLCVKCFQKECVHKESHGAFSS